MITDLQKEYQALFDKKNTLTLDILGNRYPAEWKTTCQKVLQLIGKKNPNNFKLFIQQQRKIIESWNLRIQKSGNNSKVLKAALPHLVKAKLSFLALDEYCQSVATGNFNGSIKLNKWNGWIMQKLLFSQGLNRKPVSLFWFSLLWPYITQKGALMTLVQKKGIYCFFSSRLIKELTTIINNRSCLEIGAGDGTLTRFLQRKKVSINATDNYSWQHCIEFPDFVEKLDAKQALQKYRPQVVICCWPPDNNDFEKHIFTTKEVELYIMIGSKNQLSCGNWDAYQKQSHFSWHIDEKLSSQIIPPLSTNAVLLFHRVCDPK